MVLLKNQIQLNDIYFKDLTGFIQRFINQSAPRSGQKGTPRSRARGETGRRERRGSHSGKNGLIMTRSLSFRDAEIHQADVLAGAGQGTPDGLV